MQIVLEPRRYLRSSSLQPWSRSRTKVTTSTVKKTKYERYYNSDIIRDEGNGTSVIESNGNLKWLRKGRNPQLPQDTISPVQKKNFTKQENLKKWPFSPRQRLCLITSRCEESPPTWHSENEEQDKNLEPCADPLYAAGKFAKLMKRLQVNILVISKNTIECSSNNRRHIVLAESLSLEKLKERYRCC